MRLVLYNDDGSEAMIWMDVLKDITAGRSINADIDEHLRFVHTLRATRFILAALKPEQAH